MLGNAARSAARQARRGDSIMNERITPLNGTRVLIVEDEYYLADDLSRALVQAGAQVVGPIGTLDEATRQVDADGFDCAVVDMNLRGDFVFALAERLRNAGMPFLIATGYNQDSLPSALVDVPRIEKPFAPHQVVEALAQIVEKSD